MGQTGFDPLADQFPFKFRHRPDYMKHHSACRCAQVQVVA
jgi:hypothetical protein